MVSAYLSITGKAPTAVFAHLSGDGNLSPAVAAGLSSGAKKSAHGNGSADVRGVSAVNGFWRFLYAEHADAGDDTTHLTGGG